MHWFQATVLIFSLSSFSCAGQISTARNSEDKPSNVNVHADNAEKTLSSSNTEDVNSVAPQKENTMQSQTPVANIEPVGSFSNIEENGEVAKGFIVRLWKNGDKLLGTISGSHTLKPGEDMPFGILENIAFDPKEKTLSFDAKMSFSSASLDMVQFKGKLGDNELKGDLRLTDVACRPPCTDISGATFKKLAGEEKPESFASEEEWEKHFESALQKNGAKW